MPIFYGEAGSGKTSAAIAHIIHYKNQHPWRPVWILLPNELQTAAFRDKLMAANPHKVLFGIQFFTFYQLYRQLLNRSLVPYREIGQGGVVRLLGAMLANQSLQYFGPIADKVGFVGLLADFIDELKQSFVQPQDFQRYAQTSKDRDLADIYEHYQNYLIQNKIVDREGAGWLANSELGPNALHDIGLLVVDGFQNLSPLQAQLLGKITQQIPNTVITLTHTPQPRSVHRIFERTRQRLLQFLPELMASETRSIDANTQRHPSLSHLVAHFYEPNPPQVSNDDALWMLEMPDYEGEVQGVLRHIKRRLLSGERPEDMIIIARSLTPYNDLLRSIGAAYSVPLMFKRGIPLEQNPAIRAIMLLLGLQTNDFGRVNVLDTLQTPYFRIQHFSIADVDTLARIAITGKVMQSPQQWLEAIEQAQTDNRDEDGEVLDPLAVPEGLHDRLAQFFGRVLPPTAEQNVADYIEWIESLLGPDPESIRDYISEHGDDPASQEFLDHFRFFDQVRAQPTVLVRDLEALHSFRRCLREMFEGYRLLEADQATMTWQDFYRTLQLSIQQQKAQPVSSAYRHHNVLVTTAFEGRGLHHSHVFIMGLSEGIFPAVKTEDPLYSDRERLAFEDFAKTANLSYELLTTAERQDDVTLFFECMAIAKTSLTLTRPTLNEKADSLPPSVLWRNVEVIVSDPHKIKYRAGQPPDINDAATLREAEAALTAALVAGRRDLDALETWMETHNAQHWSAIVRGYEIESGREDPRHHFDRYAGVLQSPAALSYVQQALGPHRRWSASQFNDFGACPFRFFAKRLLKLEELPEPEEGLDALQLGNIQHEILELIYQQVRENNWPIHPDYLQATLDMLGQIAPDVLQAAPRKYGFRRSQFWEYEQREIVRRIERFIYADFNGTKDNNPYQKSGTLPVNEAPRYVYRLELPFGVQGQAPVNIGGLKAGGFIDRIDRVGDDYVVMDYKSGSTMPTNKDIENARNFQMILYLNAGQQLLDQLGEGGRIVGGFFWSLYNRKFNGAIRVDEANEIIHNAIDRLQAYIEAGRTGRFPEQPTQRENGKCTRYCEFYKLCRIQRIRSYGEE